MAVSLCCRRIQTLIRNRTCRNQSTGYVVLLPEIGLNLPEDNPLIKDGLPDFSDITPEKCVNTLGKQLLDFEHEVCNIETCLKDGEDGKGEKEEYRDGFIQNVVQPLQRPGVALDTTWGIVKTIFIADQGKLPSNRYLTLHSRAHKAQYSRFASLPIFQASQGCDVTQLSEEEQRVVERYRLEGNLNGLGLSKNDKEILLNVNKNLYLEKCDFNKRIQVSKDMFSVKIGDPYIVRGFPTNLLENIAEDSNDPTAGPWIASVDPYISNKFLEYCPDHKLRLRVWQNRMKVTSLACEATELQNSTSLEKIRDFRHQQAKVLGFPNYASVSMETKMAGSLESVMSLLESFRQTALPLHKKEMEDLQEFAAKSGFDQKLQLCDVPYWSRKQKKIIYNFENEELREYFPFENVFAGLLKLCERLFNIRFEVAESSGTWHPDVKFYNIYEGDSVGPVAGFYFDPFARPEKLRSEPEGGWVINLRSAHMADGPRSIPLSSVILNLPPPIYGKPSLLSYSEVNSLFGKFGRLLQQLLCTVTYTEVSGLSFVEWDTVDVTTNFMQQCLEKPKVLEDISGHYITGEKLPVTDMAQVTNHLSATSLCADLYKSVLDLKFNTEKTFWNDIVKEIWPQYFAFPLDPEYNEPLSMTDIVTQDLCAGYYSKIWSRMIAADVFSAFNDEGADETAIGTRFRDTYLAFGGSCDPHETFRRFRGRDPSSESFLRYLRLENSKPDTKTND